MCYLLAEELEGGRGSCTMMPIVFSPIVEAQEEQVFRPRSIF